MIYFHSGTFSFIDQMTISSHFSFSFSVSGNSFNCMLDEDVMNWSSKFYFFSLFFSLLLHFHLFLIVVISER